MHQLWDSVVGKVARKVEKFNKYILNDFRRETMDNVIHSVDDVFKACMIGFGDRVIYHGYRELSIPERIKYLSDSKYYKQGNIEVYSSTYRLFKFEFEFESQRYFTITEIPYLSAGKVLFNGREYYSLLTITERGARYICKNGVKIKVMKCPLSFNRSPRNLYQFKTTDGNVHRHILLTAKIHQSKKTKTPLLCYILANYTWDEVLSIFDLTNDISFIIMPDNQDGYNYVRIRDSIYLKYNNQIATDTTKMRVIVSLLHIYKYNKPMNISEIYTQLYYSIALGKFTNPSNINNDIRLLYSNVVKLLKNCDTLLDHHVVGQLNKIGIPVNNIFELCIVIFKDIDKWISGYNPCDLYDKKMNSLSNSLADFTSQVINKQFDIISNPKRDIDAPSISSFSHAGGKSIGWYLRNKSFTCIEKTGDSSLFQLLNRSYTLDNLESGNKSTTKYVPMNVLQAHPSNLSIISITNIPSSNPIITGTVTPFTEVEKDGSCVKRPIDKLLDHVFDKP